VSSRTDKDTWDISTSVGQTALFVAAARALEAQKPDPLAVDAYAEVFCRAVGGDVAAALDDADADFPLHTEWGGHFVNFQGARTRYFDEYFRRVTQAGVQQIVLLAAGLDSRAYRLSWPTGTVVYELDQPRVLQFKRETMDSHGDAPTAERREIPVDLRDDWPQALRSHGFDPAKSSAWIAEGLLIYLPAAAQEQLFAGIEALAAPGSFVAVEEALPMDREVFEAKRAEGQVSGQDTEFFSLVYNEQHAPAEQWFSEHGWTATTTGLSDYIHRLGRELPAAGTDARQMLDSNSLVTARKT
jgi:methyltransferase (TIGR00027 family)